MKQVMLSLGCLLLLAGCSSIKTVQSTIDTGWVPFRLVKGAIIVPVSINGTAYSFVLDTGGFLTLSDEINKQEDFKVTSTVEVSDISQLTKTFDMVEVPVLSIGNWTIPKAEAIVSSNYASYPNRCFGLDGMLGRNVLKDVLLQMDYSTMSLRITNQKSRLRLNETARGKMKISDRGLPGLEVDINGKSRFIELDSGSRDWFSYQTAEAERQLEQGTTEVLSYEGVFSFGVSGKNLNAESRYSSLVTTLKIGNILFEESYSDLSKRSAPRFGSGLLAHGTLTIDYLNNAYYYDGYSDAPVTVVDQRPNFSLAKINGQYIIKWVRKASEAERLGLSYGDHVLSVNGAEIESYGTACELYLADYPFLHAEVVKLRLEDANGLQKDLIINTRK